MILWRNGGTKSAFITIILKRQFNANKFKNFELDSNKQDLK